MGSLIDELQRREAAARDGSGGVARADRWGWLSVWLGSRSWPSRLVITREMVDEVLSEACAGVPPTAEPEVTAWPGAGHPPVIGVLAVPPWRAGLEASALPQAYQDLLEVAEDAGRPLRAAQIAAAAGLKHGQGEGGRAAVEAEAAGRAGLAGRGSRAGAVRPARA